MVRRTIGSAGGPRSPHMVRSRRRPRRPGLPLLHMVRPHLSLRPRRSAAGMQARCLPWPRQEANSQGWRKTKPMAPNSRGRPQSSPASAGRQDCAVSTMIWMRTPRSHLRGMVSDRLRRLARRRRYILRGPDVGIRVAEHVDTWADSPAAASAIHYRTGSGDNRQRRNQHRHAQLRHAPGLVLLAYQIDGLVGRDSCLRRPVSSSWPRLCPPCRPCRHGFWSCSVFFGLPWSWRRARCR